MNIPFRFALLIPLVLTTACRQPLDSNNSDIYPVEVYQTISDSVPAPEIAMEVNDESGEILITWTLCDGALAYELEKSSDGDIWEIVYYGPDSGYYAGMIFIDAPVSFRVRAVYPSVLSDWSEKAMGGGCKL